MNDESTRSRILTLDVIRGVAILGILGVNIHYFAFPEILASSFPVTDPGRGLGYWIGMITEFFLSGKMRSLLAMLFGVSAVIVLQRLEKRHSGTRAAQIYFRRLLWLMIFGQIHAYLLLFPGDILFHYAVVGAISFPLLRVSARVRGALILLCLGVLTLKPYHDYTYTVELESAYTEIMDQQIAEEDLSEEDVEVVEEWETATKYIAPTLDDYEEEVDAKRAGFASVFEYNQEGVVRMVTYDLYNWYAWEILLYMLLGTLLFERGFFSSRISRRRLVQVAVLGLLIGGAIQIWLHLGFYRHYADHTRSLYYLIFFDLGRLPMVLGMAALICLLVRSRVLSGGLEWLASFGRMALSNYLMQSVIAAIVFYGFGAFNRMNRVELGLLVLGIWVGQLIWSRLWLRSFTYGPFEWVWRSLSLCEIQPLRPVNRQEGARKNVGPALSKGNESLAPRR